MSASILFHFDGPIVENHQISLRVLGNTLTNLQSAIDRAYIDSLYGEVWKYARLRRQDYPKVDFIVGTPQDGGYILNVIKETGQGLVQRIYQAVDSVTSADYQEGAEEVQRIANQVVTRQQQLASGIWPGRTVDDFQAAPGEQILRTYSDRSIAKEIDQMLVPIRRRQEEGEEPNTLELVFDFDGARPYAFRFNQQGAEVFHNKVSRRELGEPLRYTGTLQAIDRGGRFARPKAKLTVTETGRNVMVHVGNATQYQVLAPHMQGNHEITFFACPILEFNTFDLNSGDIYFIGMAG